MQDIVYNDKRAVDGLGVLNVVYKLLDKDQPSWETIKLVLDSNRDKFFGE